MFAYDGVGGTFAVMLRRVEKRQNHTRRRTTEGDGVVRFNSIIITGAATALIVFGMQWWSFAVNLSANNRGDVCGRETSVLLTPTDLT